MLLELAPNLHDSRRRESWLTQQRNEVVPPRPDYCILQEARERGSLQERRFYDFRLSMRRNAAMQAPQARKGAHGTAPNGALEFDVAADGTGAAA